MSWLSKLFGSLFGRKPPEPPSPAAPQPTESLRPTLTPVPPAPTPPRPDPAALEPVRPTPVASPPGTTRFGDWRDPLPGESADAYYARTGLAGYGKTGAELYQQDQDRIGKTEIGKLLATERYNGPIPVASLTDEEKAFLTYVVRAYNLPENPWYSILNGSLAEINLAINQGDPLVKVGGWTPDAYIRAGGRLVSLVDQVARGLLKPRVTR